MEAKRFKIDQDNNGKVQRDSERTTATKLAETLIYIVPKKIPKARLQVLSNLAQKKGFPLSERFSDSVTHIVTAYDTVEKIHAFLERQPARNVEVVSLYWLTDCITEGKIVNVTDKVRIKSGGELTSQKSCGVAEAESSKLEETSFGEYQDTKFVCQRATPLIHHNTKFTNALEILERHAVYVDSSQRDSRALAFRRAACALKSYPKQITRIEEASKLSSVGSHSKKVIQEILENGSSDEVQDILSSDFFKTMELFSSIYGCGPATARKW
ncbi:DNA nucleotidylexotransferase-like isoform X2 [Stylophora pistillata]|uniref:DNA nucleotidylexotransferase-like isoform X2 n=1 Tax=Stylophora pistillata TaxID=50429 RepID=UPI000C051EC2|nr:DNA nucleotidylexotransferase-like isoform X2 [Stylophora pistillata]